MEETLLHDIVVIFGLSIAVLLFCFRFSLPSIVGFLFTGVLGGPYALGLIQSDQDVEILANIGIVLLLFIVGMEFSFKKISEYKRYFLIGGTLQVFLTVLLGFLVGLCTGSSLGASLFLGFLLSLSSTAIVLRLLEEKRESDTPHGRVILGIMIFQDMVAIPMMLLIPFLGGTHSEWHIESLYIFIKGFLALGAVIFCAVKLIPRLLYYVAKTKNRELFLLSIFMICASVAWLTSGMGLSLSLGAFLAGLIISDSEYRTEAVGDILPFQDIFTSFFFVSIGMLLNLEFFWQNAPYIIFITMLLMGAKAFLGGIATFCLGMPIRTVCITAFAISQIGEFSFVLAKAGMQVSLSTAYQYQLFLAVSLLSMVLTPLLMQVAPSLGSYLLRLPIPVILKTGFRPLQTKENFQLKNHVIIVGFGLSGRNLASSCREANIPYVILEMNAETVKKERRNGEPIHFGDASHESVLHHANLEEARAIAVVINDPHAVNRIVQAARKINKSIYIVVRTRYLSDMKEIYNMGADEVIPDEFGSSVEVLARVLKKYQTPTDDIQKIVSKVHVEGYEMIRLLYQEAITLKDFTFPGLAIDTVKVAEGAHVANKTLNEIELRKSHQLTALLIKRGEETFSTIHGETSILPHDVVVLLGTQEKLSQASPLFKTPSL